MDIGNELTFYSPMPGIEFHRDLYVCDACFGTADNCSSLYLQLGRKAKKLKCYVNKQDVLI